MILFEFTVKIICCIQTLKQIPTLISSQNETYFLDKHLSNNVVFVNIMSLYFDEKLTNMVVHVWPVSYTSILKNKIYKGSKAIMNYLKRPVNSLLQPLVQFPSTYIYLEIIHIHV